MKLFRSILNTFQPQQAPKIDPKFVFDDILERKIGFGKYQYLHMLVLLLIEANDGCQLVMMSFMNPILKAQWSLSSNWISFLTCVFYVGASIGSLVTGKIGDYSGRKPAIVFSSLILFCISISFRLIEGQWDMAFARFLYGICYGFSIPLPSAMLSELVPQEQRGKCLVLLNFFVTVGKLFGCLLAYICLSDFNNGDWKDMMMLSAIPPLLTLIGSILILRESPRFLIAKERFEEGCEVLNYMIRVNEKDGRKDALTGEDRDNLVLWQKALQQEKYEVSIRQLLIGEQRKVTLRLWVCWLVENAQYFGQLVIMPFILGKEKLSFSSYTITILGEAPSFLVSMFIVDIKGLGRKNSLTIFFGLASFFHLLSYLVPVTYGFAYITSTARFCMKMCFAMLYPISTESYPTLLRSIGFGSCSGIGRLGAAFVPYLIFGIMDLDTFYPFLVFAALSAIGCLSSATLPFDTLGRAIDGESGNIETIGSVPQTVQDLSGKKDQEMSLLVKNGGQPA